jgi:hypothetical protein
MQKAVHENKVEPVSRIGAIAPDIGRDEIASVALPSRTYIAFVEVNPEII